MTLVLTKNLLSRLLDRGLVPTVEKIGVDEYKVHVSIAPGETGIGPAEFQTLIDLGIGIQVGTVTFT